MARWWHPFLLLVLGLSWGLQFTLLKVAAESDLSELGILTVAMLLLAVIFAAALAIKKDWFVPSWRHIRFFVISAFFGYILTTGGILLVADHLSAGLIVFYSEALIPVFTIVLALMFRTERLTLRRLAATALALLGVAVVMWPELSESSGDRVYALLIFLIVPLAYALDGVYVAARWPDDLRSLQVITGEAVAGAVILLPFCLLHEGVPVLPPAFGAGEWAIIGFILISCLEAYIYFYLLKTEGAVFVSFGVFVSLSAGIAWGMMLLGEQHRPTLWIAVGLVSIALYLITARARPARAELAPA